MAGRQLGGIAAAVTIVIALAIAPAAAAFVPREDDSFFGVSAPNFYLMNQKGQGATLDSYLTHIQATGAGWVRDAVPWPDAEPTPPVAGAHTYRWGNIRLPDHAVRAARSDDPTRDSPNPRLGRVDARAPNARLRPRRDGQLVRGQ
jgi:hypothetical protein